MPSTVEKLSPTRAKITIEVPFAELEPAIRKAYRDLAAGVSIPGFRAGHVPPALIDARLGRGAVLNEAVNAQLPTLYAQAVQDHGLLPLGQPEVEVAKLEDGVSAELVAEVDVVSDFDLPDYSGIEVTVDALPELETLVAERVAALRERFAGVEDVDRAAEDGDLVHIDLKATRDGAVMEGGLAEGLTYVVGSGGMLDGLDEAVTGCRAGDERTFTSQLSGDDDGAGPADITVTVTAVQARRLPEVDDEFAQMVSPFDTQAEMMEDLRRTAANQAVMDQLNQARGRILERVIAATPFELPEAVVREEAAKRVASVTEQLAAAGLGLEDYLQRMGDPAVTNAEEFAASTRASAERGMRGEIILDRVADAEQVTVDQDELTTLILQKAAENGTTPQQEIEHMRAHDHLAEWMGQIRQSKALDTIVARARVTTTDGKIVNLRPVPMPPAED